MSYLRLFQGGQLWEEHCNECSSGIKAPPLMALFVWIKETHLPSPKRTLGLLFPTAQREGITVPQRKQAEKAFNFVKTLILNILMSQD